MSAPVASYAFLSWARQGLGIHTQNAPAGEIRGTIPVGVTVRGTKIDNSGDAQETFSKNVALYGPGDVIGIDPRAIVRSEPRHWITNFEPNYLAFVEFYDEDFPWRYTPAAPSPDSKRLTPWLTLVVLEEGESEFREGGSVQNRPLPFITVINAAVTFPPAAQLWAWAHVHIDGDFAGLNINDAGVMAAKLGQTVGSNRDHAYSRLACPRALKPNTGYHAFVIPSFETGRLAGLGFDPAAAGSATKVAWDSPGQEPTSFPVYHRWYFRTGSVGDFEYLVRLLKPKAADPKVGTRDIDVQDAGAGVGDLGHPELSDILRLGGALRVPYETLKQPDKDEFDRFDKWARPFPQPFQQRLAAFVNLPATYADSGTSTDPVIAPPIYGRWHAAVTRLLDGPIDPDTSGSKWLNETNLDPRYRVAAGFGTSVVQKNQEDYMEAAWQQVGRVLAGNQRIRYSLMAMAASKVWNAQYLEATRAAQPEHYLMLAAPVQRRVIAEGLTVYHWVQESTIPSAIMSKVVRQTLRPRARIARAIGFDALRNAATLIGRVNRGEVVPAPPKVVPPGLPTAEKIAERIRSTLLPPAILDLLRRYPWLRWLPLVIAIAIAILLLFAAGAFAAVVGLALVAAAFWLAQWLERQLKQSQATDVLTPGGLTPAEVDELPKSPDFKIEEPSSSTSPPTIGTTDSDDARRFKLALKSAATVDVLEAALPIPVRTRLDLSQITASVSEALRPEKTIPAWTLLHVAIPPRIREKLVEDFGEVMVYPEIDLPMYEPLKKINSELFLPNIQLIEQNSITLLETNQKFIEAYMVGLNHEFGRELLWREYPTDQRGSYFRQFWDIRSFLAEPGADVEALKKRLRDITELHTWSLSDELGDHDNREAQGDKEEELVLVIRGELLKKYPNAVVYAHRADWERDEAGAIDKSRPRKLHDLTPAMEGNPPRDIVKTPLYDAAVEPDIYFFGFDITVEKAKGGFVPEGGTEEDPGWFFVIKERPGEPRFGLDIGKSAPQATLNVWNDLAWSDVMEPFAAGAFLSVGARQVTLTDPGGSANESQLKKQYEEDKRFRWYGAMHAAEIAYIMNQVPVLMAVHAAEMLPKEA
jgi:hypothetical protein